MSSLGHLFGCCKGRVIVTLYFIAVFPCILKLCSQPQALTAKDVFGAFWSFLHHFHYIMHLRNLCCCNSLTIMPTIFVSLAVISNAESGETLLSQASTHASLLCHTHSHPHPHACTQAHIHSFLHTNTHSHDCVCVLAHVDVCIHVYTSRFVRACTLAHLSIYSCISIHTHMYLYIHICRCMIHKYIHMYK